MSEKITFKQLIEQISGQNEQSQNSTNTFLHELVQIIESGLQNSGSVSISGFGKFELRWMNQRSGRNPQTGEEITIPGQNKVVFKPYKALRESVNRPYGNRKPRVLDEDSDKKETANIPPVSNSDTSGSSQEDDDLVVERNKPLGDKSKPTPKSAPKKNITKSNPFTAVPAQKDEVELIESVQESGSFKWSYAAASLVVMLAILAIIFMMMRPETSTQTALSTASDNAISQTNLTAQISTLESKESTDEKASPSSTDGELVEFMEYQVSSGETLWSIAEDVYGDPFLWPLIFSTNNDQMNNPNILTSGINLKVPTLSSSESLSQTQLDQIATGYLSVYEWTQSNNPDQAKYFLWAVGNFSPDILAQASNRVNSNDLAFAENQ